MSLTIELENGYRARKTDAVWLLLDADERPVSGTEHDRLPEAVAEAQQQ